MKIRHHEIKEYVDDMFDEIELALCNRVMSHCIKYVFYYLNKTSETNVNGN